MKRTSMHSLEPASARKRIAAAKSNKPFMAALLDRGHREHKEAVEQWTRLHQAAFPESISAADGEVKESAGRALTGTRAKPIQQGSAVGKRGLSATLRSSFRPVKARLQDNVSADGRRGSRTVSESQGDLQPPVVNMEADRIQVLLNDAPARFEIDDNPDADPNYGAWRASHTLGRNAVRNNDAIIEREANAQGVDADLVRAIMYVENAQGLNSQIAEATHILESESLLPMNIRPDPWAAIEDPPADLTDPATNVRIAVTLIRRIAERIDNPTPAKVASVWNFIGRESVNDFGERVGDAYDRRIWVRPVLPTPGLDVSP